jgi:dipeptidyl aminopeptidase/acylaminoacyl peptidase
LLLPYAPENTANSNIAWSPDGTQLAYTVQTGSQHDIWILTPGGSPATAPLLNGPAREHSPVFSPDGRWLAYVSDESGRYEVYVQRYPRGERLSVSVDGGVSPVWRRDGGELFFAGNPGKMYVVSVTRDGASLRLGRPVALFDLHTTTSSGDPVTYAVGSNSGVEYDVMPDGRFVMVRQPDQSTTREIVLLRNWRGER